VPAKGCFISGNNNFGVSVSPSAGDLDARYCWWGSASGPYHPSGNPNGEGDRVSDDVVFAPWVIMGWSNVYNVQKDTYYYSIQVAVDDASPGDTIRVYEGSFREQIIIHKTLTIIGNGTANSTIQGENGKVVVVIRANRVNLSGFTFLGTGRTPAAITVEGNHVSISQVSCLEATVGIRLQGSHGTIISRSLSINTTHGVFLEESLMVKLSHNDLMGGILISGARARHWNTHTIDTSNSVNGRTLYYSVNDQGLTISGEAGQVILVNCTQMIVEGLDINMSSGGITLAFSSHCRVTNTSCGGSLSNGIHLYRSHHNILVNNTCSNNKYSGICLEDSDNNTVISNTCDSNIRRGVYVDGVGCILRNNTCVNSDYGMILSSNARETILSDNYYERNYIGVYLVNTENNTISGAVCVANDYGLYFYWSHNNTTTGIDSTASYEEAVFLEYSTNNILANSSITTNRYHGIHLFRSPGNVITGINCSGNDDYGILLRFSDNCTLLRNVCLQNLNGIVLESSGDSLLTNNTCIENEMNGIWLKRSKSCQLRDNICSGNEENGIHLETSPGSSLTRSSCFMNKNGVMLKDSENTSITGTECWNNTGSGIFLRSSGNCGVTSTRGWYNGDGLYLLESSFAAIMDTEWSYNEKGIRLRDSHNTTITGTRCQNNTADGINLVLSNNTRLVNDIISGNRNGIYLSSVFENNSIHYSNIHNNTKYGIKVLKFVSCTINATSNWWGDPTGPHQYPHNTMGKGDHLGDHTLFEPWLAMPFNNERPRAVIDPSVPVLALNTDIILFKGHGKDDGAVVRYVWWSDRDGELYNGTEDSFFESGLSNGTHAIYLRVQDEHWVWSEEVTTYLVINGRPYVKQSGLTPNPALTIDTVWFTAQAFDDDVVTRYVWSSSIDGELYNGSEGNHSHAGLSSGIHTIGLKVQDERGAWSDMVFIELTIIEYIPPNKAPKISIAAPANGSLLNGSFMIVGTAWDEDGSVKWVEVSVDGGNWTEVNGTDSWSHEWDTTGVENGDHEIRVRAFDGEDYSCEMTITTRVENTQDGTNGDSDDDGDDGPGFEIVGLLIVLAVCAYAVRKRRN